MARNNPIDPELESQYNVRAARQDYETLAADWNRRSEAFRAIAAGHLDLAYGDDARHRLDVFTAAENAPTLVYLHGGYWQRGDKSLYSFVAEPFVAHGVNVVVMNYRLCPAVTVPDIGADIRRGLAWLYHHGAGYDLAADRIHVAGHSAGGHLAALMLTTPWPDIDPALPADLVKSAVPISGLYDLAPLMRTSINHAARIDADAAREASPLRLSPNPGARVLAVVGGAETQAFHDQAGQLAETWTAAGARVEPYVEPGVDHFDVVNRLADADSGLFHRTLARLV